MTTHLERQPDGTLIDWGRHWRMKGIYDASGPAYWYKGEALEVMNLILKAMEKKDDTDD